MVDCAIANWVSPIQWLAKLRRRANRYQTDTTLRRTAPKPIKSLLFLERFARNPLARPENCSSPAKTRY
jgi:hypothetical protein